MEKNRSTKVIAIAALFIAVIGLSIGFAAFSSTLTINSSATVTPDQSQWKLGFVFSTSDALSSYYSTSDGSYSIANNVSTGDAYVASADVKIKNFQTSNSSGSAVLENLSAAFTEPGQKVTYRFYVKNEGSMDAYLHTVRFTGNKTCGAVASGDGDAGLVSAACNHITVKINIAGQTVSDSTESQTITSGGKVDKTNGTALVTVDIEYAAGYYVDTPIAVTFKAIELDYNAVAYSNP